MSIVGNAITIGGSADLISKSITVNGTYSASDDSADGYSQVTVTVPEDVLTTKTIIANDTYNASDDNADGYSSVTVNVQPNVGTKSITANGTYTASTESLDGYSEVTVNVSGGASTLVSKSITANGNYNPADDSADGYSAVSVNVPNSYSASDEGKVVSSGALVAQTSTTVTANGTYDTTENDSVTVNVEGGGGDDPFALTDYIQSSGTQYINTGYVPNDDTEAELIFKFNGTPPSVEYLLFGSRNAVDYNTAFTTSVPFYIEYSNVYVKVVPNLAYTFFVVAGTRVNEANSNLYRLGYDFTNRSVLGNIDSKVQIKASVNSFLGRTEDGDQITCPTTPLGSINTNTQPLYLPALNEAGQAVCASSLKIYVFRIKENGTLIHEFIPWIDDNSVVCMKDTVDGTLYYNAGTGDFVYGTDS